MVNRDATVLPYAHAQPLSSREYLPRRLDLSNDCTPATVLRNEQSQLYSHMWHATLQSCAHIRRYAPPRAFLINAHMLYQSSLGREALVRS